MSIYSYFFPQSNSHLIPNPPMEFTLPCTNGEYFDIDTPCDMPDGNFYFHVSSIDEQQVYEDIDTYKVWLQHNDEGIVGFVHNDGEDFWQMELPDGIAPDEMTARPTLNPKLYVLVFSVETISGFGDGHDL